jgi:tripeptide aminopeptidase
MDVIERFLKYTKFNTQSDESSTKCPSTEGQLKFARYLKEELENIGMKEVDLDENGYLMATLPSNLDKKAPVIGFIAHMDTAPDMSGKNVKARVIDYKGGNIVLNEKKKIVMKESEFEDLKNYVGKKLIVTDGTTLLGADDKAGVAEIVTAMEYLINNPEIKHTKIRICFTPDEEIGRGADRFDVKKFGADFAYTIDGGPIGELEDETFNAATAVFEIKGRNIHPGTAKDKMINAGLVTTQLLNLFPEKETPQHTEKREGFYHLISINGNVEEAKVVIIVRDFDKENFNKRKSLCENNAKLINEKYGKDIVKVTVKDSYYNMKEVLKDKPEILEIAKKAMENIGIKPIMKPIRGGTDGSRLSFMGLPCPNIFTGGHNYHGKYEYLVVESAKKAVEVILEIAKNVR